MSDAELILMFYNVTAGPGGEFIHYIQRFDIFDNLDESLLFSKSDKNLLRTIRPS